MAEKRGENTYITETDEVVGSPTIKQGSRQDAQEQNEQSELEDKTQYISCCTQHAGIHYIKKLPHAVNDLNVVLKKKQKTIKRVHFRNHSVALTSIRDSGSSVVLPRAGIPSASKP